MLLSVLLAVLYFLGGEAWRGWGWEHRQFLDLALPTTPWGAFAMTLSTSQLVTILYALLAWGPHRNLTLLPLCLRISHPSTPFFAQVPPLWHGTAAGWRR